MHLNETAEIFLEQIKKMYTASRLPYCILDGTFQVVWCNDASVKAYPSLSQQNGLLMLLKEYDLQDIRDEISVKGHFTLPPDDPNNLFLGRGLVIYAAPADCGALYIAQPRVSEEGTGLRPKGLNRSIASFESHYREPLTAIFSSLSLLQQQMRREHPENTDAERYVRSIGQSSMELMRATQMMADYTRLANGLYPHKPRCIDLFDFLKQRCRLARQELETVGIELSWDIPDEALFTVTEPEPLHLLFCQLISNAGRFTRPGNHITVTVRSDGQQALVTVADRGCGIPAQVLPHIFEPYYSHSPDGAPFAGNGLGLAIAQAAAAFLGGELTCTSSQGQGSSFRLTMPLREDDTLPGEANSPEDDLELLSSMRVLLADCIHYEKP